MSIFGPSVYLSNSHQSTDMQILRRQEARIALRRVLEFTRHSLNDVINDPVAKYRVRHCYKVTCFVDRYLQAQERRQEERADIDTRLWIGRP